MPLKKLEGFKSNGASETRTRTIYAESYVRTYYTTGLTMIVAKTLILKDFPKWLRICTFPKSCCAVYFVKLLKQYIIIPMVY